MLPPKPWQPESVIRLLLWLFVSLSAGGLVVYALNPDTQATLSAESKFQSFVLGTLFLHGTAMVLIASLLRQHQTGWSEGFGFGSPGVGDAIALAVGACGLVLPVAIGLSMATSEVMSFLANTTHYGGFSPVPQQAVRTIQETTSPFQQAVFGVFAVIIAPVVEEMLFRGILYPAIKQNGWPRAAWVATSFFFALTHSNVMTFLSLFVLSMVLIWLYERTANLAAPIVTHSLFNAVNLYWLLQSPGASPVPN